MRRLPVLLILLCVLVAVPAISAASTTTTVYASPAGVASGTCSSVASACSLSFALATYRTQADVSLLLESGTYPALTSAAMISGSDFTIAPDSSDVTRPVIQLSGGEGGMGELDLNGSGEAVSGVDLNASSTTYTAIDASSDAQLSDLRINAQGYTGVVMASGVLRDSLVVDTYPVADSGGYGVLTQAENNTTDTPTFDSDTIVAPTGTAIDFNPEASGDTVQGVLTDAIAQGQTSSQDLVAQDGTGATATAAATSSDLTATGFGGSFTGTGDVTTAPDLDSSHEYREQTGSSTIGTGKVTNTQSTDLDGNLRSINGAQDIGAYELGPAPVLGTVTETRSSDGTSATLTLTVTPGGELTSIVANSGPTTSYGTSSAPLNAGNGTATETETFTLNGLVGTDSYHADIVAMSDGGTSTSQDVTIAPATAGSAPTPSSPAPPTTPTVSTPAPTGPPDIETVPIATTPAPTGKLGAPVKVVCGNERVLRCQVSGSGQGPAKVLECSEMGRTSTCTGTGNQMQCHTNAETITCTGEQLTDTVTCAPSAKELKNLAREPKKYDAAVPVVCSGTPKSAWSCDLPRELPASGCTFLAGNVIAHQPPDGFDKALLLGIKPTAVLSAGNAKVDVRCTNAVRCAGTLLMVAARHYSTMAYSVPGGKISTLNVRVGGLIKAALANDGNGIHDGSASGVAMLPLIGDAERVKQELTRLEGEAQAVDSYGDYGFTNAFLAARGFAVLDFSPYNPSGKPSTPLLPGWNSVTNTNSTAAVLPVLTGTAASRSQR